MEEADKESETERFDSHRFKLVSQFDTEDDAMKYAAELHKYYNQRDMEVKVEIQMNLEDVDDTPGQRYLSEAI